MEAFKEAASSHPGTPVQFKLESSEYEVPEGGLFFDGSVGASEVVLSAAPGVHVVLRPSRHRRRLTAIINVSAGEVTLERVQVREAFAAPAVVVSGGRLVFHECALVENLAGALHVTGGEVQIEDSVLANNSVPDGRGGAVFASGGKVTLQRCNLTNNVAQHGGAVHMQGDATAHIDGSLVKRNIATVAGGAISLAGGQLVLSARALLQDNSEPSVVQNGAKLQYRLPAPDGRWIDAPGGSTQNLEQGVAGDFPFACAPGVFGRANDTKGQSTPSCSGFCLAGYLCSGATVEPEPCPEASFCPVGSAALTPCPPGTTSWRRGLANAFECEACPKGHWCSSGKRISCGVGTYNDVSGATDQSFCTPCPPASSTSGEGHTRIEECVCNEQYYAPPGGVTCKRCPVGSNCRQPGVSLENLPLLLGYYRTSGASDDLRRCPDFGERSGCVGGVANGEGPCRDWLTGPYCSLCNVSDRSRFYSQDDSACIPCKGEERALLVVLSVAILAAFVAVLWRRFKPHRRIQRLVWLMHRLMRFSNRVSLHAKCMSKQLLSFYQIVTRISDVYHVPMPDAVKDLLSIFEVLNINIAGLRLPMQCFGLGRFEQQLLFTMIAPCVIAVVIVPGFVIRACCSRSGSCLIAVKAGLLSALPWLLILSILVLPMVSSAAFRAFSCEEFQDGRSFLRADYSIECTTEAHDSEEHNRAKNLAWLALLCYPGGISALYLGLMLCARRAIVEHQPTALSRALGVLVRDYEPMYFWWELMEAWRKLCLVGFAVLVMPGSIVQLTSAFLFAITYLLIVSVVQPYKSILDNQFAKACNVALIAVFFFSVLFKVSTLGEQAADVLTPQLRSTFDFDAAAVSVGMVFCILGALALATAIVLCQTVAEARRPVIQLHSTKTAPDLPLARDHKWHMFLSHIWVRRIRA